MKKTIILISMLIFATAGFSETCKRKVNNTKATIAASIDNGEVKMKYSQITNGIPSSLKLKDMEFVVIGPKVWVEDDFKNFSPKFKELMGIKPEEVTILERYTAFVAEGEYENIGISIVKIYGKDQVLKKRIGSILFDLYSCE